MGDAKPQQLLAVGARVLTCRGLGTVLSVTPYQVRVQQDDGDDPWWLLHRDAQPAPIEDEQPDPTVIELVDAVQQLLDMIREKLSAAPTPPPSAPAAARAPTSSDAA